MRVYLLCVPLCVLLGLTRGGAPLSKQPLLFGGIDMSELEVEMSAGCDPNDDGCEVVEPLVSIEMRALDTNATVHIPPRPIGGTEAANVHGARDAFFVWLTHPPDSFWVNLAPTESDRVIDSELGRTEVGKTMLDADLLLKRTAAKLLHPDHEVGAKFWNELYGWVGTRGARLCHSFRQWIVPGVAKMQVTPAGGTDGCDDGGGASCVRTPKAMHVLHAPLRVMQEAAYVSDGAFGFLAADADEAVKAMCEGADPDARREADALFERIVLPVLEREVNESPEYSKLRAAYLWRVVGESYRSGLVGDDEDGDGEDADEDAREEAREEARALNAARLANATRSMDIRAWRRKDASDGWTPGKVFESYAESATRGEFHLTRDVSTEGGDVLRRTYFHGGIDWRALPVCVRRRIGFGLEEEETCVRLGAGGGPVEARHGSVSVVAGSSEVVSRGEERRFRFVPSHHRAELV